MTTSEKSFVMTCDDPDHWMLERKATALDELEGRRVGILGCSYDCGEEAWVIADIMERVFTGKTLLEAVEKMVAGDETKTCSVQVGDEKETVPEAFTPQTNEMRARTVEAFTHDMCKIMASKGHDYTGGQAEADMLGNFRLIANLLKGCTITPYTVGLIYKLKHITSILTFARTGHQESGEPLHGRHVDDANYSYILDELVLDHAATLKEGR